MYVSLLISFCFWEICVIIMGYNKAFSE